MIKNTFILIFMTACGLWAYYDGLSFGEAMIAGVLGGGFAAIGLMIAFALLVNFIILPALKCLSFFVVFVVEFREAYQAIRESPRRQVPLNH